jgi:hypothetical protein
MASRSSSSTRSPQTFAKPSERGRSELPNQRARADSRSQAEKNVRGPSEKKHKNMAEVELTGRQSDQGDRPKRRLGSGRS